MARSRPLRIFHTGSRRHALDDAVDGWWRRGGVAAVQQALSELNDRRLVYADCGAAFLDAAGEVRERLMPDRLHPNAEGLGLLADCIRSTLSYTFVTDPEQASRCR